MRGRGEYEDEDLGPDEDAEDEEGGEDEDDYEAAGRGRRGR